MSRGRVVTILLAACGLTFGLGEALLSMMILHSMHRNGTFHGLVFPIAGTVRVATASWLITLVCLWVMVYTVRKAEPR